MNFLELAEITNRETGITAPEARNEIRFYFWTEKLYSAAVWDESTVIAAHDVEAVRRWVFRRQCDKSYVSALIAGSPSRERPVILAGAALMPDA